MPDKPFKPLLDRTLPIAHVEEHFSPQLALLEDLANYGSNLIVRAFNSSPKNLGDAIVCGVLLRQIVAMVDAVDILLRAAAVHPANLPARTAFEASLYLEWMLASDLDKKAKYYYVSNLRLEKLWTSRATHGTTEYQAFEASMPSMASEIRNIAKSLSSEASSRLAEVNRILKQPSFKSIDEDFEQRKIKSKRNEEPKWHTPLGIPSVRQMAKALQRLDQYEFFYSKGSSVMHTSSYKDYVSFSKGEMTFQPIRHLEGIDSVLNTILVVVIWSYQLVLRYYRSEELASFSNRYQLEWQKPFLEIKEISYKKPKKT